MKIETGDAKRGLYCVAESRMQRHAAFVNGAGLASTVFLVIILLEKRVVVANYMERKSTQLAKMAQQCFIVMRERQQWLTHPLLLDNHWHLLCTVSVLGSALLYSAVICVRFPTVSTPTSH